MRRDEGDYKLVETSDFFDPQWYLDQYPDVQVTNMDPIDHYLFVGAMLLRNPSERFCTKFYMESYPEVKESRINPLVYHLRRGEQEGKLPSPRQDDRLREHLAARIRETKPSVSVVMPTWNRAHVIRDSIDSILHQSLLPLEILVVDDGSTDSTLGLLEATYARQIQQGLLRILRGDHGGVSRARNIGLDQAKGDIIAYLDSDNRWLPDHLLYLAAALDGNSSAYTAAYICDASCPEKTVISKRYDREQLLRANFIDLNTFGHARTLYTQYGGFDESLTRLVDWELVIRYTRQSDPKYVPVLTVEYILDQKKLNNITFSQPIELNRNRVFLKHADEYKAFKILNADQLGRIRAQLAKAGQPLPATAQAGLVVYLVGNSAPQGLLDLLGGLDATVHRLRPGPEHKTYTVEDAAGATVGTVSVGNLPPGVYWRPDPRQPLPTPDQLRNLVDTVALTRVDLAVASYSLERGDTLSVACLANQMVFSHTVAQWMFTTGRLPDTFTGKVLHLPPCPTQTCHPVRLEAVLGRAVELDAKNQYFHPAGTAPAAPGAWSAPPRPTALPKKRKRVFVIPHKLAVGGVERNTIEVMRALRDTYDFIYITLEKVFPQQGSLAQQVMETAFRLLDIAEITCHDNYLQILNYYKERYDPDIVWICNGSMWLCANAAKVRRIFDTVPIVDQQVYDEAFGWISHYNDPGIVDFDHFIAINSKIQDRFLRDFHKDPQRVHLIYSVINGERFQACKAKELSRNALRTKFSLPQDKKLFVFMGRLVEQKRPLLFLELARSRQDMTDEHYVLVGNGVLADAVRQWLADHNPGNVQWIEYIAETPEFWRAIDGLIITSEFEGLPIAMLEALAMGVPVAATDVGDIRLVLEQHDCGVTVSRDADVPTFSKALDTWKNRLDHYHTHLATESDRILDRFSAKTIASQYKELWEKAVQPFAAPIEGKG